MPTTFSAPSTVGTKAEALGRSALIYQYGYSAAIALLAAFDDLRTKRGNPRGVLTDQEQDVLRAVVVMCCAALDGSLKQAIRDALPKLLHLPEVSGGFEKFLVQRLAAKSSESETEFGAKFLAKMLAAPIPRERLIEEYVRDLTGESLQSAEQVFATAAALGTKISDVGTTHEQLKSVFRLRNQIIHELDIQLDEKKKGRRTRSKKELVDSAVTILKATHSVLLAVDAKLG